MSERVLHEWNSAFTSAPMRLIQDEDGGHPLVQFQLNGDWITTPFEQTAVAARVEFTRLASRVTELEAENAKLQAEIRLITAPAESTGAVVLTLKAENAKLHDAILDIYNAHQDEALEIRMRECGRWTEIRALVGEANDRAARAEVKL